MRAICRAAPKGLARRQANERRRSGGSVSGITKAPQAKLAMAMAAAAKKGARVPSSPANPPISGPATNPTPKPAPIRPKFWARRSAGLMSAMKALAVE